MTAPITLSELVSLVEAWGRPRAASWDPRDGARALASLSEASFRALVLEAISRQAGGIVGQTVTAPSGGATPPSLPLQPSLPSSPGVPADEAEVIGREAQRVNIDPALLAALRRVENGGPGREFGVLSVPAPGLEEQARVAANTIRKNAARFVRQGGEVIDPATGRYTEAFLRFFSARYAPLGAGNDPNGLNRFHAANLIALYRRVSEERSSG